MDRRERRNIFLQNVARGQAFERREKAAWKKLADGQASFEVPTRWKDKSGRIDIRVDELGNFVSVIELKATDWNRILPHRIRPNALRHARQVWRYLEKELSSKGLDVCPGIIYPKEPSRTEVKAILEEVLNERGLQVVWRAGEIKGHP